MVLFPKDVIEYNTQCFGRIFWTHEPRKKKETALRFLPSMFGSYHQGIRNL